MSKRCSRCKKVKELDCFYKNKRNKDGYQVYCRVCTKKANIETISRNPERRKEITKKSRHKCWFKDADENRSKSRKFRKDGKRVEIERRANIKRKEHFKQMKLDAIEYLGGECMICGYNKCIGAIDFHHRDPSKKEYAIGNKLASLSSNSKTSYLDIKDELDKCDVLCRNCHSELHYAENHNIKTLMPNTKG